MAAVLRVDRQQALENTPFCFGEIASAQTCLQKAALNQSSWVRSIASTRKWQKPNMLLRQGDGQFERAIAIREKPAAILKLDHHLSITVAHHMPDNLAKQHGGCSLALFFQCHLPMLTTRSQESDPSTNIEFVHAA